MNTIKETPPFPGLQALVQRLMFARPRLKRLSVTQKGGRIEDQPAPSGGAAQEAPTAPRLATGPPPLISLTCPSSSSRRTQQLSHRQKSWTSSTSSHFAKLPSRMMPTLPIRARTSSSSRRPGRN
jgi:hypothetical protein